jgi:LysM repeat protein
MSLRFPVLLALLSLALLPATSQAGAVHLIVPGETLSGIAAANGLSPASLAVANGLRADAFVIAGRTLSIPAAGTASAFSPGVAVPAPLSGYRVRVGDTLSAIAAEHELSVSRLAAINGLHAEGLLIAGASLRLSGSGPSTAPTSVPSTSTAAGSRHLVNPGETLSGIAAAAGTTTTTIAAANGLRADAHVIAGTTLRIPSGAPSAAAPVVASSGVAPSAVRLSAGQIGAIAAQHGAPASLATAIAWQESGFNNRMVSVTSARGIMQVMPATWDYVQSTLAPRQRFDPASATDNVSVGSILLARLLRETGSTTTAVAAYYQGLGSVRRIGLLPETRRYVADVLALQSRFGG